MLCYSNIRNFIKMRSLLYILVVILLISWLLGNFAFHIGGDLIHVIIVIAILLFLYNMFWYPRAPGPPL